MFNLIEHIDSVNHVQVMSELFCKHSYILSLWCLVCRTNPWTNRVSMMLKLVSRSNDHGCQIAKKNVKVMVSMSNLDVLNK